VEKQQMPILVFGLTSPGLESMIYRIRGKHANHYTKGYKNPFIIFLKGSNCQNQLCYDTTIFWNKTVIQLNLLVLLAISSFKIMLH
jgi:hypothetical protein